MIDFSNTMLLRCIGHYVGNKNLDESVEFSNSEIELTENLRNELKDYFIKPFKTNNEVFTFFHDIKMEMNEVFVLADKIFEKGAFVKTSKQIVQHLFNQTRNSTIKRGEVFICEFDEIVFENTICKGIGIFKAEKKETFFKVNQQKNNLSLLLEQGLSKQRVDKGCLILNDEYHNGYKVFLYESGGQDTEYWRDDFLGVKIKKDSYHHTDNFLDLAKEYIVTHLANEYDISRNDQVRMLNKSVSYFQENESFNISDFNKEVFEDKGIIQSFQKFGSHYSQNNDLDIPKTFDISRTALKKQVKEYKTVLKLDKNFHIYIHGDGELITQGVEKDGRKYYKIYYNEERFS